jgi:hypothetical protein
MGSIAMVKGSRHTFAAIDGAAPVYLDGSDHAGGTKYYRTDVYITSSTNNPSLLVELDSNSTDTTGGPHIQMKQRGSGDCGIQWRIGDSTKIWTMGIDNSNSDTLVVSMGDNVDDNPTLAFTQYYLSSSVKAYFADEVAVMASTTDEGGQLRTRAAIGRNYDWMFDNYQDRARIFREDTGGGGGYELVSIDATEVGISVSNPSTKLDVDGTVTCTGFNNTSDVRLKTNINTITSSLDVVKQLRGVTFNWSSSMFVNSGSDESLLGTKHGFIAQEVETIVPSLVFEGRNSKTKGIKYTEVIPILLESIKEQQTTIDNLISRVTALENQ